MIHLKCPDLFSSENKKKKLKLSSVSENKKKKLKLSSVLVVIGALRMNNSCSFHRKPDFWLGVNKI